jgi:hypothetical protein
MPPVTATDPLAGRTAARPARLPGRWLVPREHGAWAMLLFPFCSALVLARAWSWRALPAMVAAVGVFVLKEPLLVLARQAWIWKEPRPETAAARRSLLVYGSPTLLAGAWLCFAIRPHVLLGLGAAAMALTGLAVYLALENHPRALLLQLGSALGLSGSALLAWLALRPTLTPAVWWLWAAHAGHSTATLLAVRARLAALAGLRSGGAPPAFRVTALLAQAVLLATAFALAGLGRLALAAPLVFSAGVHLLDLARLRNPAFLRVPLRQVGQREVAVSALFSVLVLTALW